MKVADKPTETSRESYRKRGFFAPMQAAMREVRQQFRVPAWDPLNLNGSDSNVNAHELSEARII
jgi:hypothetical protein